MAKTLRQLLEAKYVSSADFVLSASGRKVHKRKKIADDEYDKEKDLDNDGDNDGDDQKLAKESVVPDHMKGKQKPYVSSDGKGNYEVLGNTGQTKAEFSRKEHGKDAHAKAQAHLKSKYDQYMKEETELEQLDDVTYYDGSDMLGEAQDRYSKSYQFTHKPGDTDSEKKLTDLKKSVKGSGKRVVLMGRLGKDNPNAHKYKKGGEVSSNRSQFAGTHKYIKKGDAAHHDVYVYDRRESVEHTLDEGVNKSDIPAYLRKKTGDQLTTKDLDKERTQNRSHPETIKKINGTEMKEGRSDSVIQTTAANMDDNDKHVTALRDAGIHASQGAGASHHILVPREHEDRAREILAGHLKEAADPTPVAPSIGVHRIGVTVSDSDHPAVTKRKELIQKFVRVTAHDKDRAIEIGKKHFAKKGWKVHDASHSGMVHEEAINEYSMDDVRKDAADRLKKSIDKQSDDRIAALKNPPKKKGFFARVGEKQINMVKGAYHGLTKEEVELEEAKDKTDKRFDLLARLGLVEKDELANLRLAMKTLSEDKQLSIKQRDLLLNVYESLISLVTGDDTMFSRMKIKVQEESLNETKNDVPFDGPYTKTPDSVKDKSGAEHTPQSRARHLARLAMKQMAKKSKKA